MELGTTYSTRAHKARVLRAIFYFFNSAFHVIMPRWIKKYGTRAHQARVPEKVVNHYFFPKQSFLQNISRIDGIWPFWPMKLNAYLDTAYFAEN